MHTLTPIEAVGTFVEAMNRGDVEAAVAHYETNGMLIAEPGVVAVGTVAIQEALSEMLAMRPRLTTHSHEIFASDELALYHSKWSMRGTGPDGAQVEVSGQSSDVLRRQADGTWKIAIDNPWGTTVLGGDDASAEAA